jgi:hypothetical protein
VNAITAAYRRVTRRELQRQTRALRKANDGDPVVLDSVLTQAVHQARDGVQRRSEPRFVLLQRGEKRLRVPRRIRCLQGHVGDVWR